MKGVLFSKRKRRENGKRKKTKRKGFSLPDVRVWEMYESVCTNRTEKHEKKRGGVVLTTVLGKFFQRLAEIETKRGCLAILALGAAPRLAKWFCQTYFLFSIRLKKKLERNEGF